MSGCVGGIPCAQRISVSLGNVSVRLFDVSDRSGVCVCVCCVVCVCVCVLAVGPGPVLAAKDKDVIKAQPPAIIHGPLVHSSTGPHGGSYISRFCQARTVFQTFFISCQLSKYQEISYKNLYFWLLK